MFAWVLQLVSYIDCFSMLASIHHKLAPFAAALVSPATWHLHRTFQATIYHSYKENPFSPVLPPTFWPHLISHCLLVSPHPLATHCIPLPCFPGCLLYDEVHILRDSRSHLHFSLSPLFGVSVEINAGPGSTEGRETHSQREKITGRGRKD